MASNKHKLNNMNPAADDAKLGEKLDQAITLLNEVKTQYNLHTHDAGDASNPPATASLVASKDVDVLD